MIHFYVGKPRNGKTYRAFSKDVWEEITAGQRYVITNLVIFYDDLQALLIKRGFSKVYVRDRIRMLDDKETKNFWLHRPDRVLDRPDGYDDKTGPDVDYSPCFHPETGEVQSVLYVIDEVHTHWRARGWSGTPRHVDFYNSQHGKLGDKVVFITQNTKLVDQNFIRLAQDFTYVRNHRLEKHGKFRGDNKLTAHTYPGPVSNDKEVTLNVETFHLDFEIADCYDTSAGVGMPGGGKADAGFRTKGVPLKMIWVGLGAVGLSVWFVLFKFFPDYIRSQFSGVPQHAKKSAPVSPTPAAQAVPPPAGYTPAQDRAFAGRSGPAPAPSPVAAAPLPLGWVVADQPKEALWVQGIVQAGSRWRVILSDGRVIEPGDEGLERIDKRGIVFDGRRVFMRPMAPRVYPQTEGLQGAPLQRQADSVRGETGDRGPELTVSSVSTEAPFQPLPGFGRPIGDER